MKQINLRPELKISRTDKYKGDEFFEKILANINLQIQPIENKLIENITEPSHPLILISFAPRSGSTFLSQLMATSKKFHYVSNFIARFWDAPYFGGLFEKKMGLRDINVIKNFNNTYGVTQNINDPHEFGFFWRKWLPLKEYMDIVDIKDFEKKKLQGFVNEINALRSLYEKPFFIKNGIAGINIELFSRLFNNVKVIVLKRDYLYIAQSLYKARIDIYGNPDIYLSTKPSNYSELLNLNTYDQIVSQIDNVYNDIYTAINKTNVDYIEIDYESLCTDTTEVMNEILKFSGIDSDLNKDIFSSFCSQKNIKKLEDEIFFKLKQSIEKL